MMILHRESIKVNLGFGEEADAKFINDFYSEWKDIKKELAEIIVFAKESWKKEETADFDLGYFG